MNDKKDVFTKGMASWSEADDDNISNYSSWQHSLVKPYLGRRILEVGAGQGRITSVILNSSSFEKYTALEPSDHFINVLRKRFGNIEIIHSTTDKLDSSYDNGFDTILLSHLLEHIEDDNKFISDLNRLLCKNGRIIILVPALGFLMSDLDRNIGHYRRYDKRMIKALAVNTGYRLMVNRYDNFIGMAGWFLFCRLKRYNYQSESKKTKLMGLFKFYDTYILPASSAIERFVPPPVGLNILAVLEKP